ncbi:MAG: adenylate kinase [Acidobacteriota bacterium]|nr:adenylate kinase [Acidobacteriota bacterium]
MGPPGAGKGTQSRAIGKKYGIPEISTGEMLRDAVRRSTPLGVQIRSTMESGGLVPDEVVCGLIEKRTAEPDCQRGFIVDGFPRDLCQALFLDRLLEARGQREVLALSIRVQRDILLKRLAGRRVCPVCETAYNIYLNPPQRDAVCDRDGNALLQRRDDSEEAIGRRLEEYERQTAPLILHYGKRGVLREIDGNGAAAEVTAAIFKTLGDK